MTTEDKGEGIAQEDATQAEDAQQDEAISKEADEAADKETSPPSDADTSGDPDEGGQTQDKPDDADKPSRAALRKARKREYVQSIETELSSLQQERERILKAGEGKEPPKPEDFDSDTGYEIAAALYKSKADDRSDRVKELDAKLEDRGKQVAAARDTAWAEQVAEARTRYSDFEQVAFYAPISNELAEVVKDSDLGADIAYFLGKNPNRAREISAMSRDSMLKAIGALETRLVQPKAPKRTVPEPQEPVRGGADGAKRTLANARSLKEFEQIWIEEQKRQSA